MDDIEVIRITFDIGKVHVSKRNEVIISAVVFIKDYGYYIEVVSKVKEDDETNLVVS